MTVAVHQMTWEIAMYFKTRALIVLAAAAPIASAAAQTPPGGP
jgi:hypothetical protein